MLAAGWILNIEYRITNRQLTSNTYLKRNEMLLKSVQAAKLSNTAVKLYLSKM